MAAKRIKELTALASPLQGADEVMVSDTSADADRKLSLTNLLAGLGVVTYTVSALPTATANRMAYASDGRKSGEGSGAGTGVLVIANGTNWKTVDTGGTVAA